MRAHETGVAGGLDQTAVEVDVRAHDLAPGDVVGEPLEGGEGGLGGRRDLLTRSELPHDRQFERTPQLEDLLCVAGRELGHEEAAVDALDQQAAASKRI